MKTEPNNDAFSFGVPENGYSYHGLTKREYFAAMAMQGILANSTLTTILAGNNAMPAEGEVAKASLYQADELITELNKQS